MPRIEPLDPKSVDWSRQRGGHIRPPSWWSRLNPNVAVLAAGIAVAGVALGIAFGGSRTVERTVEVPGPERVVERKVTVPAADADRLGLDERKTLLIHGYRLGLQTMGAAVSQGSSASVTRDTTVEQMGPWITLIGIHRALMEASDKQMPLSGDRLDAVMKSVVVPVEGSVNFNVDPERAKALTMKSWVEIMAPAMHLTPEQMKLLLKTKGMDPDK